MSAKLSGKTVLVTGGSRGLGRWICHGLAVQGARVAVNFAHNAEQAEETLGLIRSTGGCAEIFRADITDETSVNGLLDRVEETWNQPVDILINNAAGPHPGRPLEEYTWEHYLNLLQFFVKAPLLLTQRVVPRMKDKRSGCIINIGSEVVQLGSAGLSAYVAAKSAMLGMTRSWATELGPWGIRVNLVAPGFIPVERHQKMEEEVFETYKKGVLLGRMGVPMDIANTVAFLASDEGSFITGQQISVNGGKTFGI